ncbi:hypothetical protein [Arthrobacter burdickii]|uniref:Uncharacterized protein n=1 Tax=Arthrobacter burdickii TaxID=3035920 RepID=A0ABT8K5P2_9MICC|nr:hypothetical protein [Arthrobacter burdickii]MDN4612337.1 hypothetical protein [Arthrobacter burdickii]
MLADPVQRMGPDGSGAAVSPGFMVKKSVMGLPLMEVVETNFFPG